MCENDLTVIKYAFFPFYDDAYLGLSDCGAMVARCTPNAEVAGSTPACRFASDHNEVLLRFVFFSQVDVVLTVSRLEVVLRWSLLTVAMITMLQSIV